MLELCIFFFFFSSRRRHTRLQGDWSSDVCSSDLRPAFMLAHMIHQGQAPQDDLVPHLARAFRALQAAAGDGVVAGQQDGRADEQRDQGEQRGAPPGSRQLHKPAQAAHACSTATAASRAMSQRDRKSTRLNSSHLVISYAVFCLKKKNTIFAGFSVSILHQNATDGVSNSSVEGAAP